MFVGCQGQQGDDPPRSRGGNKGKSLEIESRRLCLVAEDPRSTKRVGFINVGHRKGLVSHLLQV